MTAFLWSGNKKMIKKPLIILQVALPVPLRKYFDYLPPAGETRPDTLQLGMRLRVPFGQRELTGILTGTATTSSHPAHQLKAALALPDTGPLLDAHLLELGTRLSAYYHHPIGEVLSALVPVALRNGEPLPTSVPTPPVRKITESPLSLNPAQAQALAGILAKKKSFQVLLLEGVTGSGKTEVYLQAMDAVLADGRQVLVLLPEIGLTPQTLRRFEARFAAPIVVMHSRQTHKKRLTAWLQAREGSAHIIIGTRSAVFSPLVRPGLIIVDEEHDLSFKQQDGFRYHARDVAILRAKNENIPVVLGSATPSLETLHNARSGRYHHLILPERAGNAVMPSFQLSDIRNCPLEGGLSPALRAAATQHLSDGNQVLFFLNRRGFAPALLCHACGWIASCSRCDMRMTWHKGAGQLRCHHCDRSARVPQRCEKCSTAPLSATGLGTERLEENLTTLFPSTPIVRIDRDSTRRAGQMEQALARIEDGSAKLLTGTQMLAKGHHFPNVTLVAILDADGGFFSADFRGPERMGQLMLQVAGRAGRAEKQGTVMIQTHQPDHPLLHLLIEQGYAAFADALLAERQQTGLPPFSFFSLFRAEAHRMEAALAFLEDVNQRLKHHKALSVMGPISAPMAKRAGKHRCQLLLQSRHRPALQQALTLAMPEIESLPSGRKVRWSVDVDPLEMH